MKQKIRKKMKKKDLKPGDILLFNFVRSKFEYVSRADYLIKFCSGLYRKPSFYPIGIVAVSPSQMPDGMARIMSLNWMNCDSPETGGRHMLMTMGKWKESIKQPKHDGFLAIDSFEKQELTKKTSMVSLCSDRKANLLGEDDGPVNPFDSKRRWDYEENYAPSPYDSNGGVNEAFRATSFKGKPFANALADFDGKKNTEDIVAECDKIKKLIWKLLETNEEDYPAATCCNMYYTIGTKQGDWYLPSCGELAHAFADYDEIAESYCALTGLNGDLKYANLWTSTIGSNGRFCQVDFATGSAYETTDESLVFAMAFLKI